MTDHKTEPKGRNQTDDSQEGEPKGPDRWVPKGALSGFLLQGAAWAFIAQLLALGGGFSVQLFLARLLTPEALGVYFLTQSLVIMVANIGGFGLNRPIARMISTDVGSGRTGPAKRALRSALGIASISGFVVIGLFVGGFGEWIARSIFDSGLMASAIFLIALWIAGLMALNIGSAVLQGMHRVGLSAILNGALVPTVLAAITGSLLWFGMQMEFLTVIWVVSVTTVAAGLLCIWVVTSPFSGVAPEGPPRTRTLIVSALPIFASGMLQVAADQADLWIIGAQLETSDVALYGASKRLAVLVGFPLAVLAFVVPPLIADLYARGEHERLQRLVRAATTAASLPAAVAFVLFISFGSEILTLAYGEAYADGATILKILIADKFAFLMMGPGSLVLVMTGHERVVFRIAMVSATLSLLAIYLGGLLGGLSGVALAFALSSSATGLWYMIEAHRHTKIWVFASPFALKPMMEVIQRMIGSRS